MAAQYSWEGRVWVDASNLHTDHIGRGVLGHSIHTKAGKAQRSTQLAIPSFKVVSYSVVADLKTPFFFHTCNKGWEKRFFTLMQEISSYDADILCLQDVDHFSDQWCPALMLAGYDSVFKVRTQVKDLHDEGVMVAVKRDRFRIVKTVEVEFNDAVQDDTRGASFRDRSITDDVGLLLFVQPVHASDLASPLCIGSVQLNPALSDEDVRNAHCQYLMSCLETANREFHAPVVLGMCLNDRAASMSYTMLRTGRQALSGQVPPKVQRLEAHPVSRTSAMVKWYAPKLSIADPAVTSYRISWRIGGSTALGYYEQIEIPAGDCIAYVEVVDENRNRKVVAKEQLQYTVTRLCAEVSYEFRVCAVNPMGIGPWSSSTEPIVLPNPEKASPMPALVNFLQLEQVREMREFETMRGDDMDALVKESSDLIDPRTNLTPRTVTGLVNDQISSARILPPHNNARLGWRNELGGQPDRLVLAEISREFVTRKSILRDRDGFKDKHADKYDDLGLHSTFSKLNRIADLSLGQDGSTLLLDCKEVVYHLGAPNKRQVHHQSLRSAYDVYSCSGEPNATTSLPPAKLWHSTDCLDYLFYSEGSLVASRILTLPSWTQLRMGETPDASQAVPDYCHIHPFAASQDSFDMLLQRLMNRLVQDDDDENGENGEGEGGARKENSIPFVGNYTVHDVARMKQVLHTALERSYGSNSGQRGTGSGTRRPGSRSGKKTSVSRSQSPTKGKRTRSLGTGVLGPDYQFFGGRWTPFAMKNPARTNYYLPNPVFGSTHLAMATEFLMDDSLLTTTYGMDAYVD